MPSAIKAFTDGSHNTGLVTCFFNNSTIAAGSAPGCRGAAEAFIQMVCIGLFMLGSASSKALPSFSEAGDINGVWKPPPVFKILACKAPALSAAARRDSMAFFVPPTEKPLGKSSFAIWQMPSGPSSFAAVAHNCCNCSLSKPATDTMPCSRISAASCMASPRSFTRRKPSSKEKTPAAHKAVYSPKDKPAITAHRVTASSRSPRNFSRPARPPMNMAGWQKRVSSSFSSGPERQTSKMS
mmetsp:Transcript_99314/g.195050  ORF Transcript_99314/g.195050 Transcript_99314/m.195050 type:complete len:240 (+) Transcript_99314:362-1081(+)